MNMTKPPFFARWIYPEAIFEKKSADKKLLLTFDDGPHPEITPQVLETLAEHNIKATFFCLGERAKQYPEIIQMIRDQGHDIGNHGYRHLNGWQTDNDTYIKNVEKGKDILQTNLFRPPYGRLTPGQYHSLKKENSIIFWNLMLYDFDARFRVDEALKIANKSLNERSIIVLHDNEKSGKNLVKLLKPLIELIKYNYL
ncbi:MAG: polysaccharide deacetylase family protein [Chitinophagales bacterium]|nr:polysaccharide deacetylase family protein [Chitinophagales bacterium]